MGYSNFDYFHRRIPENELLKLIDNEEGNLSSAIEAADSLIDSYLRNQINELPLLEVPPIISQLSFDISMYYLHDRIQFVDIPDRIREKYEAAIKILTDISSGKIQVFASENNQKSNVEYGSNIQIMRRDMF